MMRFGTRRAEFRRGRWDGRVHWRAADLASPTDRWAVANIRDASGQSGDFLGHSIDAGMRYWLVPDNARLEIGSSLFSEQRVCRQCARDERRG